MQLHVSFGRTSAAKCCTTNKCAVDDSLWQGATWQALNFNVKDPHFYRYSFVATNAAASGTSSYTAIAEGDLDCDGQLSKFTLYAEGNSSGVASAGEPVGDQPLE